MRKSLHKYNMIRTVFNLSDISLLMGNGEIGGLADKLGGGFEQIWGASFWKDPTTRFPLHGPLCYRPDTNKDDIQEYHQELSLEDGLLITKVGFTSGGSYESRIFFSMVDKTTLVIQIKNLENQKQHWNIQLPDDDFAIRESEDGQIAGNNKDAFTQLKWKANINLPVNRVSKGLYETEIPSNSELLIFFSATTHWLYSYQEPYAEMKVINFNKLYQDHQKEWMKEWDQAGTLLVPDEDVSRLFYRSLFFTLCTTGSHKFLPGEQQFAEPSWDMHPFTYGAAGWSVIALAAVGYQDRALHMLKEHYKPDALSVNAAYYLSEIGKDKNPWAWSFAHEVDIVGFCKHLCHMQRHLDAFAGAMYHTYNNLYPNSQFESDYVYPVLKGTAEFWSSLATWNEDLGAFTLPPLMSLSEDITEPSILDAVLAAKWTLQMAVKYAQKLKMDSELQNKWKGIEELLYIPENDKQYLEYLGDDGTRAGAGYNGVRAPVYFSYPTPELIPYMNKDKIITTFDKTWERNEQGHGMITFVANWFALAEANMGRGNKALEISNYCFSNLDPTGTALYEVGLQADPRPYFLTSHASYVLVPILMLLQSVNNKISVFPALPDNWTDVEFSNLPAVGGITVSGKMSDGVIEYISYTKDGEEILRLHENKEVVVEYEAGKIKLVAH